MDIVIGFMNVKLFHAKVLWLGSYNGKNFKPSCHYLKILSRASNFKTFNLKTLDSFYITKFNFFLKSLPFFQVSYILKF